jgi:flagellar protein FliO/FliZ
MDPDTYLRFLLALIFVLGLIGLFAWVARRFALSGRLWQMRPGQAQRLRVVESLPLDPRRRVVLLRKDDTEHLVLLGASTEVVLDRGQPGGAPHGPCDVDSASANDNRSTDRGAAANTEVPE